MVRRRRKHAQFPLSAHKLVPTHLNHHTSPNSLYVLARGCKMAHILNFVTLLASD